MEVARAKETRQLLGTVPPHNLEAEECVLGAVLFDNEALYRILETLTWEDFYREANGRVFSAMISLFEAKEPVDLIHLTDHMRSKPYFESMGGATFLASLTRAVPSSANVIHHAQLVKKYSILRQMIGRATDIIQKSYEDPNNVEEILDDAEKSIFAISEYGSRRRAYSTVKEILKDSIKLLEERAANRGRVTGVPTRFPDLDRLTCGFQPSDLIIIAGRPSMGKTAFCMDLATHAAVTEKIPTIFFSLEMSKEQLVMRMLCNEARIDSNKVRSGNLDMDDWRNLIRAANTLQDAPLFIDDTPGSTPMALRSKARRLKMEADIGFVIIDYLQLMRGSQSGYAESREREISDISRSLKALAKELNLPVIAISQLNRSVESRVDKRPMNNDLRESGALEQDADLIGFVYRDEVYNKDTPTPGVAEFILSKQRNGPTGTIELSFLKSYTRFESLEQRLTNNG